MSYAHGGGDRQFKPIRIAILTVSDSRDETTDKSGRLLVERVTKAGHQLADKAIVPDDVYQIRAIVSRWIADPGVNAIDPDVDEARRYLREDFQVAQSIERWGFVEGVGSATSEEPHRNLMNAPWWTDGLRLVMDVPNQGAIPLEEQRFFYWDWATEEAEAFNEQLRRLAE
jgi:hypothetical protein